MVKGEKSAEKMPNIQFRPSDSLFDRIEKEADKHYMRPSAWVEDIVRKAVREMDKDKNTGSKSKKEPATDGLFAEPKEEKTDGGIF